MDLMDAAHIAFRKACEDLYAMWLEQEHIDLTDTVEMVTENMVGS